MKITIEIRNCNKIAGNIEVQQKAIKGKPLSAYDITTLMDTKSILIGIQQYLNAPRKYRRR